MILSDRDIKEAIAAEFIVVEPFEAQYLQPSSLDIRVGRQFRIFDNHRYEYIDPRESQEELTQVFHVPEGRPFVLHPREFVLGTTIEYFELSEILVARLEGKSSLGRLGLLIHSTAGYVDPGFKGQLTLELSNVSNLPIRIWPGDLIGQISFFMLKTPAENPYGSKGLGSRYQDQLGPTAYRQRQTVEGR